MAHYQLRREQTLPISISQAWEFFSAPDNLKAITPPYMGFETLTQPESEKMFPGQIVTYYIRPVLGIKIFWMTEITHVRHEDYFVDEQRYGPYAFWHHTHFFKAVPGGVHMTDLVHYKLPFGILGRLVHRLFIQRQLKQIFDFRHQFLLRKFGSAVAR